MKSTATKSYEYLPHIVHQMIKIKQKKETTMSTNYQTPITDPWWWWLGIRYGLFTIGACIATIQEAQKRSKYRWIQARSLQNKYRGRCPRHKSKVVKSYERDTWRLITWEGENEIISFFSLWEYIDRQESKKSALEALIGGGPDDENEAIEQSTYKRKEGAAREYKNAQSQPFPHLTGKKAWTWFEQVNTGRFQ